MAEAYAYLLMVTQQNNNKYYRMIQKGGNFLAEYGRVGANPQRKTYPMSRWQEILDQKLRKGYVDQTHLHEKPAAKSLQEGYEEIEDAAVKWLVETLLSSARNLVKANYRANPDEVTPAMVREAQNILWGLSTDMSVYDFNQSLLNLFSVIPRRMAEVSDYLAHSGSSNELRKIAEREQAVLDAMSGQVYTNQATSSQAGDASQKGTILDSVGLSIRPCTEKEVKEIKDHMKAESSGRFDRAWRVYNKKVSDRLDEYAKAKGIRHCKYLYHGSATENFWNILVMGLDINPNARIAGKMFGNGTYFANRAMKSMRYTDLRGMNNVHGGFSSQGFLSVFKVAYKKALDIHVWDSTCTSLDYAKVKAKGCDAVFAHKGASLQNDEIIVYQNCQSAPHYIIALK